MMDMFVQESKNNKTARGGGGLTPQVNKPTTMSQKKMVLLMDKSLVKQFNIVVGGMFAHEQQKRKYLVMTNYAR